MIEQLTGDDRLLHISRASDEELLIAAIAGSSSETGRTLLDRSAMLADLFMAARSEETAVQIADCAIDEDNLDWYFLFQLSSQRGSKSKFAIEKVVADLQLTERGRLALAVVARNTLDRNAGWMSPSTERLLVILIQHADEETMRRAVKGRNPNIVTAVVRGRLARTNAREMFRFLQEEDVKVADAWRLVAQGATEAERFWMLETANATASSYLAKAFADR